MPETKKNHKKLYCSLNLGEVLLNSYSYKKINKFIYILTCTTMIFYLTTNSVVDILEHKLSAKYKSTIIEPLMDLIQYATLSVPIQNVTTLAYYFLFSILSIIFLFPTLTFNQKIAEYFGKSNLNTILVPVTKNLITNIDAITCFVFSLLLKIIIWKESFIEVPANSDDYRVTLRISNELDQRLSEQKKRIIVSHPLLSNKIVYFSFEFFVLAGFAVMMFVSFINLCREETKINRSLDLPTPALQISRSRTVIFSRILYVFSIIIPYIESKFLFDQFYLIRISLLFYCFFCYLLNYKKRAFYSWQSYKRQMRLVN